VSAILPVGIRNASNINARTRKASIKAVISHSRVLAISPILLPRGAFGELVFSLLLTDINANPAAKQPFCSLGRKTLTKTLQATAYQKNSIPPYFTGSRKVSRANKNINYADKSLSGQ